MNKCVLSSALLLCLFVSTSFGALKWIPVTNSASVAPTERYHFGFSVKNNTANIVGGFTFDNNGNSAFLEDTWTFNVTSSAWESANATGLGARAYFTANTYNGTQLIIFAGTGTGNKALGDIKRLAAGNTTWATDNYSNMTNSTASNLLLRQFHASVVINDTLYVMGGHIYGIDRTGNDLVAYNLTSKTWKVLTNDTDPASPPARQGHSMVIFHDPVWGPSLVVFGGYSDMPPTSGYNDVWQYSLNTSKWHQVVAKAPPPGRYSHAATMVSGRVMLIHGGMNTAWNGTKPVGDTYYGDTWSLQLQGNGVAEWINLLADSAGGPGRRQGHSIAVINGTIYSFCGYQQYAGLKNDVWQLASQ